MDAPDPPGGRAAPFAHGLGPASSPEWRRTVHRIVFGHETPGGRLFDVVLTLAIFASIGVVMLESVGGIRERSGPALLAAEWAFTILFTLEYGLRLAVVARPARYARSFFGIVDLLAILPTWISTLVPGAQALLVIRVLRILRIFRVLKLANYMVEIEVLSRALVASRRKIAVFLSAVLSIVVIAGSLMYLIEGPASGFTSIPRSAYWAIVTMTTVGYGDIAPETPVGQALAAFIMMTGYAIIAVPTGIVSVEISRASGASARACPTCGASEARSDARFCRVCGTEL